MSMQIAFTVAEVLTAMAAGARPIAGGTDLVVGARQAKSPLPEHLVAIDRVSALASVDRTDTGVRIGAGVTHASLVTDQTVVGRYTAIADGAALVGSPATRNVGTLGGNVMNGSPAMDTGAPLVVLGAMAVLATSAGTRTVPLDELWVGPGTTSAASNELCLGLDLPSWPDRFGSAYVRLEYRRAMEIAIVGAAASVELDASGKIAAASVALTAVAPTILPVDGLDVLEGLEVAAALPLVAEAASEQAVPITDLRATDRYRRHTVGVMARRALEAAASRANGEAVAVPVNRAMGVGA